MGKLATSFPCPKGTWRSWHLHLLPNTAGLEKSGLMCAWPRPPAWPQEYEEASQLFRRHRNLLLGRSERSEWPALQVSGGAGLQALVHMRCILCG